jgi:hypothetical protein
MHDFKNVAIFGENAQHLSQRPADHIKAVRMMRFSLDDVLGALDKLVAEHVWNAALEYISETCIRSVSCPIFGQTANEMYTDVKDKFVSAGEQRYSRNYV